MNEPHSVVSGGTGYVGRFIVEGLLAAGHHVTVLGRRQPADGFFSRPVRFLPFDLEPTSASAALFEHADFFVHCAFDHVPGKYRGGEGDDPVAFRRRNFDGSLALFSAAKAVGVKRAVFLSSRAAYGTRPAGEWLDERDASHPETLYGQIKLLTEQALAGLSDAGFRGSSLRITGVYGPAGPGQPHKWSGLFSDYLAGRSIQPRVGTEVHGRDVAEAVRITLERTEQVHPLLNVSDLLVDRSEVLSVVKRKTASPHPLPAPADAVGVNQMRTDRLRALGWAPGGRALLEETVVGLLGTP